MKNLKLSFALIIAILAVGVTVATKASFGKRVITACFTQVEVQSQDGLATAFLNTSPVSTCAQARTQAATLPYVKNAILNTAFASSASCPSINYFCCAKVTEIAVTDPGYAAAPFLDLGEGLKKYKIAATTDVFCKLAQ